MVKLLVTYPQLEAALSVCLPSVPATSGYCGAVTWLGGPAESRLKPINIGNLPNHPPHPQQTAQFPC